MKGEYTIELLDAEGVVLGKAQCPAELFMKGRFSERGAVVKFRATDHRGTVLDTGEVTTLEGGGAIRLNATYVYAGDLVDLAVTLTHEERRDHP